MSEERAHGGRAGSDHWWRVTGALASVRLAERGFEVVVLEKASIGNGSSSRSMAGIRAQWAVEETVRGMRYSEWWYARFHDLLHTPSDQRQPVMRSNGYLFLHEDPARRPKRTARRLPRHGMARCATPRCSARLGCASRR